MANVFKRLVGTPTRRALKKGNLTRGIGGEAYGPTSQTGYYAGVDAPDGGYVITSLNGSNLPEYRIAHNDNELLQIAKDLGGNPTNVTTAKTYLAGRANTWLANTTPNPTITDGLVLYLDPSNLACYPDGGNILYDLSGKGNNATLYNSPVISSGFITWNGSNEYAQINFNASMASWANSQTIVMWLKHNISSGRRNPWDQAYGGYGTWTHENGGSISQYFGDAGRNSSPYVGYGSSSIPKNKWVMVSTTRDTARHKWYLNDTNTHNRNHSYGTLTTDTNRVQIARGYAGYWQGKMGSVMAYDRALTPDEITSLYYGGDIVIDNLVFAMDPGNLISFDPGETTTYSLKGSIEGSNVNGLSWSSKNGGIFDFDGSNDLIRLGYQPTMLTSDITQEAWVNGDSFVNWHGIISNMSGWGTGFSLQIGITQRIAAMISGTYLTTSWTPSINTWYHIVATHRSSDNLNVLYVNGIKENTMTRGISYNSNQVTDIGCFYTGGSLPFNGQMGPVRMYNRALTHEEVTQNFNAHRSRFGL
jgi:hypothetical protein